MMRQLATFVTSARGRPWQLAILPPVCLLAAADLSALPQQRSAEPCDRYEAALRADSTNLDAAAHLGRCAVGDYEMLAPGGDSARLRFRSSWTTALRALRRVVELEPTYVAAYQPLFRILLATTRDGCSSDSGVCTHVSPVLREGDSLVTVPRRVRLEAHPGTYDEASLESQASQRANLIEARAVAERWAAAAPNDREAHAVLGRVLLDLGQPEDASHALDRAAALGTRERRRALLLDRVVALLRLDRGADARRLLDEAATDTTRDSNGVAARTIAALNGLAGRHRPPPIDTLRPRLSPAALEPFRRRSPPRGPPPRSFAELLVAGDTAQARKLLEGMDSTAVRLAGRTWVPEVSLATLEYAEMRLALGDTAVALAHLNEIDRALTGPGFRFALGRGIDSHQLWSGRAWALAGEVAAAQGRVGDARRMYRRVVGLWGGGDADLQPIVRRAQAKLDSLAATR